MARVNTIFAGSNEPGVRTPRFQLLDEWLSWQEGLHFTAIDLGLDRCCKVAERMELLDPDFAILSVAGTNGKGSSAIMLDMILRQSGYRTGLYTSPHLLRYNERICIDGNEVSDEILCSAFERIDQAREDISLTYFEFGTLAALDVFHQSGVQIAIMEVGLGGRLDAVNILKADAALVTSIDIDHENWLGHDRDSVGREKAGIFRKDQAAVCSDPEPPSSVTDYARDIGAKLELMGVDYSYEIIGDTWNWYSGSTEYLALAKPSANNSCQIQNAAGVLMLLKVISDQFPVRNEAVAMAMTDFSLHGRFQIVPSEVPYVLDVAHNRQAAQLLVRNLKKLPDTGLTHCVVGMLKDKNHEMIFRELGNIVDSWYVVGLDSDRATKPGVLAEKLRETVNPRDMREFEDINNALDTVSGYANTGDRIVITGSFLTVRSAMLWLELEH